MASNPNKKQPRPVAPNPAVKQAAKEQPASKKEQKATEPDSFKLKRLRMICLIVVAGLVCSLLYHHYQVANLDKDYYPFNTFLFNPADRFNDFNNIFKATADLNPFAYSVSVYFPFTYIVMHIFNVFDINTALLVFNISFIIFFLKYLYSNMPRMEAINKVISVLILSVLTYPFLFVVDRGNLEAWGFMAIAMFIYFYLRGNDMLSVVFLAIAVCFKLYPAVLAVLFILDRKYLMVVYTGLISAALTVISAALLKGGVVESVKGQLRCLAAFNKSYIGGGSHGLQHSSSLFVPLKLLYYNFLARFQYYPKGYESSFNSTYFIVALFLFALLGFVIFRYQLSFWKRIALLVMIFILLPQISYDYKLISVFIPMVLFINSDEVSKYNKYYTILFGLLLIPKDYIIIVNDLSVSSVFNPLIILSLILLIVVDAVKTGERLKFQPK